MTIINQKSISGITSITFASAGDDLLTFHSNNGTERFRIDNSGNTKITAGIVTTLTTTGNATVGGTLGVTGDVDVADKIVHTGDTNTSIRFPAADTVTVETAGTEALRVDSSQKLLIGTTSSQGHASGNLLEIGNYTLTNAGITINNPTNGAGLILFGDSSSTNRRGRIEYNHTADAFRFYTADSERVRITSDGKVGINTDMGGAPASLYPFSVYRSTGTGYVYTETAQSGASAGFRAKAGTADFTIFTTQGTGQLAVYDNTNSAERLRIDSSGKLKLGSNTLATPNGNADNFVIDTGDADSGISILSATTGRIYFGDAADAAAGSIRYVHTDNSLRFEAAGGERLRITSGGHLLNGVTSDEDTSGNSGVRFINAGDIQIDGDQQALVFRSTNNTAQEQSAIEWWNENGAGIQAKILCDRTAVSQAPGDLVFYTSPNVDSGGSGSDGDITERLRITSTGIKRVQNGNLNIYSTYIDFSGDVSTPTTAAAIFRPADNTLAFSTGNNERLRILSGGGITFNGDTATANALDDYEEGTWTPAPVNFDGTITINSADYVKVGKLVHINMYISFSNTVDTSNVLIGGLPYTVAEQDNHYSLLTAHSNGNIPDLAMRAQGTTTQLTAVYLNNSDGDAKPNYNHVRGQFIICGGTYYST